MRTTDLVGLAGAALGIATVAVATGRLGRLDRSRLVVLSAASLFLGVLPIAGLPLAARLRGVTGDLSVVTLVLLARYVLRPVFEWEPLEARTGLALQSLVTAGGLVLYPLTLGLAVWDPYRLGYGEPWFLVALAVLAVGTLVVDLPFVAGCLALGVLGWSLGVLESRNLWDYLLDPLLAGWGLFALLLRGAQALGLRSRAESSS